MRFLKCLFLGHTEDRGAPVSLGANGRYYSYHLCGRCGGEVVRWL